MMSLCNKGGVPRVIDPAKPPETFTFKRWVAVTAATFRTPAGVLQGTKSTESVFLLLSLFVDAVTLLSYVGDGGCFPA